MGEWINDVGKSLSLSRRSLAGKHRPPRPAGKGTGDESSVSSLSEQSRKSPRSRSSHSSRLPQMSELKRMMAEITAMQKKTSVFIDTEQENSCTAGNVCFIDRYLCFQQLTINQTLLRYKRNSHGRCSEKLTITPWRLQKLEKHGH